VFGESKADNASNEIQLLLNVSTSAAGSVQVELLEAGEPIPAFTLSDSDTLYGDSIAMPVSWKGKTDLSSLAGKAVSIRMVLKDADVYAMQFASNTGDGQE
jgi:hypothetical protein